MKPFSACHHPWHSVGLDLNRAASCQRQGLITAREHTHTQTTHQRTPTTPNIHSHINTHVRWENLEISCQTQVSSSQMTSSSDAVWRISHSPISWLFQEKSSKTILLTCCLVKASNSRRRLINMLNRMWFTFPADVWFIWFQARK